MSCRSLPPFGTSSKAKQRLWPPTLQLCFFLADVSGRRVRQTCWWSIPGALVKSLVTLSLVFPTVFRTARFSCIRRTLLAPASPRARPEVLFMLMLVLSLSSPIPASLCPSLFPVTWPPFSPSPRLSIFKKPIAWATQESWLASHVRSRRNEIQILVLTSTAVTMETNEHSLRLFFHPWVKVTMLPAESCPWCALGFVLVPSGFVLHLLWVLRLYQSQSWSVFISGLLYCP